MWLFGHRENNSDNGCRDKANPNLDKYSNPDNVTINFACLTKRQN